jgi:hypothetical protein
LRLAPRGATVCALCAVEEDFLAEDLVVDALDVLHAQP